MKCELCGQKIVKGHFYIEARRSDGKRYVAPRPGLDNGVNLDTIVYVHIPNCQVYQQ